MDGAEVSTTTSTGTDGSTTTTQTVQPVAQGAGGSDGLADIPLARDSNGNPLLQVGLPSGVGIQVSSVSGGSQDLGSRVGAALGSGANADPAFGAAVTDGLNSAFGGTPPANLVVRSLSLSVQGDVPPSQPIRISGSSSANEALVIDVSHLPPGTVLDLSDVPFAVIVGNTTLTGGTGRNVVVADGGSQTMVLGEDDDELHAGAGDDIVGSKGGNDKLFGDEGNDWVVGGVGNDELHGGAGNDVLQGGASDAGKWSFKLDAQGQLLASFTPTNADLADSTGFSASGVWTTASGSGNVTDGRFSFVHQSYSLVQDTALLVHALTGRLPSVSEMGALAGGAFSSQELGAMAHAYFLQQHPALATQAVEAQVAAVIAQAGGGSVSDSGLVGLGVQHLAAGGSWADIWLALARHHTHSAALTDAQGNLSLVHQSLLGETGWSASGGDDTLVGGAGNDVLVGGSGRNTLDGGEGTDMAVFFGQAADYQLARSGNDVLVRHKHSGDVSTVRDTELFMFSGQAWALNASLPLGEDFVDLSASASGPLVLVGTQQLQSIGFHPDWVV